MKKYRCQKCGGYGYSAADQRICPICDGQLKEETMSNIIKASDVLGDNHDAVENNQLQDSTESKLEQVPEEILREITEMHKRFMEIYKHRNYNIAAIGSCGGVQMSSEGFLDTFDKYQLGCRDSSDYPVELFTEFNGVRIFAVLSKEEGECISA